VPITA